MKIKLKGLPYDKSILKNMLESHVLGRAEISEAVKYRREAIRAIRDSKGDDRCWVDFLYLYEALDGSATATKLIERMKPKEREATCENFWKFRKAVSPDPKPRGALWEVARWNEDLIGLFGNELLGKLSQIQLAIAEHRDVPKKKKRFHSLEDDRKLFSVLPESGHVQTDFRLPPRDEFLGLALAPNAGCPSFWTSHDRWTKSNTKCEGCDFMKWGPCK